MAPARNGHTEQIRQDVTDITDRTQLISFATAGRLARLDRHYGLPLDSVARGAGLDGGTALAAALRSGLTLTQLRGLDEVVDALAPDLAATGGLSSLALRLSTEGRGGATEAVLAARVPANWSRSIISESPAGEVGVLMQGSALISEFIAGERTGLRGAITGIRDRHRHEMELLVKRLVLIAVGPPTPANLDAQILLGMLAGYSFETMRDQLESLLQHSPMSFRVWRTIIKLVQLREDHPRAGALRPWVRGLVDDAERLRRASLYAARNLDLELAVTVPPDWSPPDDDWAGDALRARARDPEATIRERGTAALGLWQRALQLDGRLDKTETELRALVAEFNDPDSRPDAAAGLRWLAVTLEQALDTRTFASSQWPDVPDPWFGNVQQAASELDQADLPHHLLTGMKNLFLNMVLQNAGVQRQLAIETVVASGWNAEVAQALRQLLRTETNEAWLRIRVEFALGYLQHRDLRTEIALTDACEHAYERLDLRGRASHERPPRSQVTEMHASLFAVGDCFGVAGAEERARSARDRLQPILEDLAQIRDLPRALMLRRAVRAVAYLLTVTAQPRASSGGNAPKDMSQDLLEKLRDHPDPVTSKLARWTLSFRFTREGETRPFLAAAEHGTSVDALY